MNVKKILALMLCAMMLLSLAACGAKGNDKQADMSGDSSAMTGEPKTAEEALALHKELLERENALLSENAELWEKVFMAADKGMTMQEDGKNYGDFLLDTVEAAKEQFTDKEYAWLKESATEISDIENKLTELEEKYPEIMQKSMDGDMSMPAGDDMSMPSDQSGADKMANGSGNGSAMTGEPKTAEEALTLHKELLERENAILSENTELWEKVFMEADKGMAMVEDGKNYGDFLLDTVETAKEQFTDKESEWLKESATEISNIENKLTELEEKYPEIMQKSMDGDMSVPAGSDMTTPLDDGSMQKFPAFEGKDLDGNPVKSDELFSGNAVTVVNFWFTTCNPCVGELAELDALNKELAKKGGSLIGVNTFTLDGDEAAISEAKDVLAKKGATYQNVYFDSDGEAGKFTTNIFAYPTTYVVDRNGNIVGDPIVGAITEKKQAETLQKLIDQALAADMG